MGYLTLYWRTTVNDELVEYGKKWSWPLFRCLNILRETLKHFNQGSQCWGQESNSEPPIYESVMVTTH